MCVSDSSTNCPFSHLSPSPQAFLFPKTQIVKLIQLVILQRPLSVQVKERDISLTWSQMLKTIKVSEEGMSQAETGWKLGFLPQTVSEAVNTKEKFLKKIRSATPVNTQMIRKQNSFLADNGDSRSLERKSNQPQHSLKPKPDPSKVLSLFNSVKAERAEEVAEKNSVKLADMG